MDFDNDGDTDALTVTANERPVIELWRNDAGSFSSLGVISVASSSDASLLVHHIAESSLVTVRIDNPTSFLVLSIEDDIKVLRHDEEPAEYVGGYLDDDDGPTGVYIVRRNEVRTAVRFRRSGDGLEELDLLQLIVGGVVGDIAGEPALLARHLDDSVSLTPLAHGDSWELTGSNPSGGRTLWPEVGIGADGRIFFRDCSLLSCVVTVGRVLEREP